MKQCIPDEEFLQINFRKRANPRIQYQNFTRNQNYNSQKNILLNRFLSINNEIKTEWLNESLYTFEIKCKELFIT